MKPKKILFFIMLIVPSFFTLFFTIHAKIYFDDTGKEITRDKHVFDLCIFMYSKKERSIAQDGRIPPTIWTIIKAIEQKQAIVVTKEIMKLLVGLSKGKNNIMQIKKNRFTQNDKKMLTKKINRIRKTLKILKNEYEKFLSDQSYISIYIPKQTYADIINFDHPQEDHTIQLKQLGLANLKHRTTNKKSIDSLLTFIGSIEKEPRVYLVGHGALAPKTKIAGLPILSYKKFINELKKTKCPFLAITSCYASGLNQLLAHQEQEQAHTNASKNSTLSFPIAFCSLPDSSAKLYEKIDIKAFFRNLHEFLKTKNPLLQASPKEKFKSTLVKETQDWIKERYWTSTKPFSKILQPLIGDIINNQPSIKLPGFPITRVIGLDDSVKVVNHETLLKTELEWRKKLGSITHTELKQKQKLEPATLSIEIPKIKHIFLYAGIVNIPIEIIFEKGFNLATADADYHYYPKIYSIIPGPAHHYIETLYLPGKHFNDSIYFASMYNHPTAYQKMFFIQTLTYKIKNNHRFIAPFARNLTKKEFAELYQKSEITFEHVAIYKPAGKDQTIEVVLKLKDTYFTFALDKSKDTPEKIDLQTAKEKIALWLKETTINKEITPEKQTISSEEALQAAGTISATKLIEKALE